MVKDVAAVCPRAAPMTGITYVPGGAVGSARIIIIELQGGTHDDGANSTHKPAGSPWETASVTGV